MTTLLRIGLGMLVAVAPASLAGAGEPIPSSTDVYASWSYYNNMGWGAYYQGNLDLARDRFTHAIEYVRPYQKDYPRLMSRSCHDLTRVLCAQNRYSDAEALAKWVVEARDHDSRTRDDVMFDSLYVLSVVHRQLGHDADAVPLLRRAVALEEKHLGAGDARLALTLKELADAEAKSDELAEADDHYRRAIAIHKRFSTMNLDLADALASRADVAAKMGRDTHAGLLMSEAAKIREDAEGLPRMADHITSPLAARDVRPGSR